MQVISASKYTVRKESTRDHVDLLLSSQCWPTVYAVHMACDVVAHMEIREPQLASAMWGNRRGCFEVPSASTPPKVSYIHNSVSGLIIFTYKTCLHLQIIHVQELKSPHSLPTPSDVALRDHTAGRFCTLSPKRQIHCWGTLPWWPTNIRAQETNMHLP